MTVHPPPTASPPRRTAGVVLGLGLGGFADGISLHQIAQWHNMGSAKVPPVTMEAMKQNMAWDGWFHAATLLLTVIGVYLLLADARRGRKLPNAGVFTGQLLLGWGVFNLVEGLVDHQMLGLHHVNETVPREQWLWWDLSFLAWGAAMLLGGWALARGSRRV